MVKKSVVLHNFAHIFLPFFIFILIFNNFSKIETEKIFIAVFIGSFFPDIDHLAMKRTYEKFSDLLKYCWNSDRYRKSFLVFHNSITILIVSVSAFVFMKVNFLISIFLISFLSHLILDILTDRLLIKSHGHWNIRSWI